MRTLLALVTLFAICSSRALAEGAPASPSPCGAAPVVAAALRDDPCCLACPRWTITPGLWLYGVDGRIGARGRVAQVESDWTDALDLLDKVEFALDMRVRVEWKRWSATLQVDGVTLKDSLDVREGSATISGELGLWFFQADLGYKFMGGRLGCGPCSPALCVEAYAGVRAAFLSNTLGASALTFDNSVDKDVSWVDPIVGVRAHLALSRTFDLFLEGDIGGFGVGSDFTWNLLAGARWNMSRTFGLVAGWRLLDIDYQDGSDIFDVQLSGPLLGLSISF